MVPWLHFLRGQDVLSWAQCCKKHLATVKPRGQERFSLPHLKLDGVHGNISYANILPLVGNVAHLHVRQMSPSIWSKLVAEPWSSNLISLKVDTCRITEEELEPFLELCAGVSNLSMVNSTIDEVVAEAMSSKLNVETFSNFGTGNLVVKCQRFVADSRDAWKNPLLSESTFTIRFTFE